MGTTLYPRGVFLNRCFDELNLTQPGLVAEVHRDYVRAGRGRGRDEHLRGEPVQAGQFRPDRTGRRHQPGGRADRALMPRGTPPGSPDRSGRSGSGSSRGAVPALDEAEAAFREQAAALEEGGVDLFILETFRDLNEIKAAIRAVRRVSALPIVAQMTTEDDGNSLDGTPPETFAPELERAGADVIGVNCSVGPAAMLETIERMAGLTRRPARRRSRTPAARATSTAAICISASPEYMASYAKPFRGGRRPARRRMLRDDARAHPPDQGRRARDGARRRAAGAARAGAGRRPADADDAGRARARSRALARALAGGRFVVVAEVAAPRGLDLSAAVDQARRFHDLGADRGQRHRLPEVRRARQRAGARRADRAAGPASRRCCTTRAATGT